MRPPIRNCARRDGHAVAPFGVLGGEADRLNSGSQKWSQTSTMSRVKRYWVGVVALAASFLLAMAVGLATGTARKPVGRSLPQAAAVVKTSVAIPTLASPATIPAMRAASTSRAGSLAGSSTGAGLQSGAAGSTTAETSSANTAAGAASAGKETSGSHPSRKSTAGGGETLSGGSGG